LGVGSELAVDEVISDPDARHPDRGAPALFHHQPRQAGLAHETLHSLLPHPDAVLHPQLGMNPGSAIDGPVGHVDL
jgi:hypothetical protein